MSEPSIRVALYRRLNDVEVSTPTEFAKGGVLKFTADSSLSSGCVLPSEPRRFRVIHWPDGTKTVREVPVSEHPETRRCCACGCVDGFCEGGPECVDADEGFPLCTR